MSFMMMARRAGGAAASGGGALSRAVEPLYTLPTGLTYTGTATDTITGSVYSAANSVPTFSGTTRTVTDQGSIAANSAALQAEMDAADDGDDIVLTAGVDYGSVTLPARAGSSFIRIRSASFASLPAFGSRVNPTSHASLMPKISAQVNSGKAMDMTAAAGGWWITGVEFTQKNDITTANIVYLGLDSGATTQSNWAEDVVFDRCIVRPPTGREAFAGIGIRFDVTGGAIIGCHISGINTVGAENKCVLMVNTAGAVLLDNNYFTAAGVITMVGGASPQVTGVIPSDIHYKRNWFYGVDQGSFKNCVEFKMGERILVESNVMENNLARGQAGYTDVLKTTNQGNGSGTFLKTKNVTMRQNWYLNSYAGASLAANPENTTIAEGLNRVDYHQNVMVGDVETSGNNPNAAAFFCGSVNAATRTLQDIRITQNTTVGEFKKALYFSGDDTLNLVVTKNVFQYGITDGGGFNGINGDGSQSPSGTNQGEPLFGDYTGGTSSLSDNVFFFESTVSGPDRAAFPNNTLLESTTESAIVTDWDNADRGSSDFAIIHASASTHGAPWDRMSTTLNAVRA